MPQARTTIRFYFIVLVLPLLRMVLIMAEILFQPTGFCNVSDPIHFLYFIVLNMHTFSFQPFVNGIIIGKTISLQSVGRERKRGAFTM